MCFPKVPYKTVDSKAIGCIKAIRLNHGVSDWGIVIDETEVVADAEK